MPQKKFLELVGGAEGRLSSEGMLLNSRSSVTLLEEFRGE